MNDSRQRPRVLLFGPADISGSEDAQRLIRQKKDFFVLAYLLLAQPRALHSRERVLAVFWPGQDETRARSSLDAMLDILQDCLGEHAIIREGDNLIGVDLSHVTCDAIDFDAALEAGHLERALELYRGTVLDQFFGETAPSDTWLDMKRERYRTAAADAAWTLASRYEADHKLTQAAQWARRAARLAGPDERRIRRIMTMLDSAGDRAGAILVYDQFTRFLSSSLEVEPSAETRALASTIRDSAPPA